MFLACADDVFPDVDRFWHVDGEADHHNALLVRVWLFVLGCTTPLRAVVLTTDTSRERIVDVQCKPVALCVDSS